MTPLQDMEDLVKDEEEVFIWMTHEISRYLETLMLYVGNKMFYITTIKKKCNGWYIIYVCYICMLYMYVYLCMYVEYVCIYIFMYLFMLEYVCMLFIFMYICMYVWYVICVI